MRSGAWKAPTIGFAAVLAAALVVPALTEDQYHLDIATRVVEALLLAMGLRLILSTGRLSLAHVSFMGIGAYTSAALVMHAGLSFWIALPLAAATAGIASAVVGAITMRLTGAYFFLITFAFMNVVELFFQNLFEPVFGGASGLAGIANPDALAGITFDSKLERYLLAVAIFAIFGGALVRLDYSRFGLVCNGIRQAEQLATTLGIDVFRYKVLAFVTACFSAGVIGSFFAHSAMVVHPTDFGIGAMLRLVVFVVVGGISSVWGAISGTILLSLVAEVLRGLHTFETMIYGAVLIAVLIFFPDGLIGAWRRAASAIGSGQR